ncbi:MAG: glycoside hydrolase family 36 protein [Bacteroidales bacterium]
MKKIIALLIVLSLISCQNDKKEVKIKFKSGMLNVDFPSISIKGAKPGVNLLIGSDETPLAWFPDEAVSIGKKDRKTVKGNAKDLSMTWKHQDGYELTWIISEMANIPGFTVRASFINNSKNLVRLKNFLLLSTEQDGLVCKGDPASWWLLPAMNFSRQGGNLAQVLPSQVELQEQGVYGLSGIDKNNPRNSDGHWRFMDEVITLYNSSDRSGISMGAVGPGVSYVKFNCRVDYGKILIEIISEMDEVLIEDGEMRESEEVAFLSQPYREALTNLYEWISITHNARSEKEPAYGWCSWYDRYSKIDQEHIVNIAEYIKEQRDRIPMNVIQIDDGWQNRSGDWTANKKFPQGMKFLADKIREAGATPGIWMAPVRCQIEKPAEWFQDSLSRVRNFDPSHPEAAKFIKSVIKDLKDAGYGYFKFDYNTIGRFRPYNPKMTRFQLMRHLFSLYRDAIGEESFLLACGATKRPVIGLADGSRIGWDAIGRWKSYPLASDSLPTLGTDIFDGIILIGISSMMNHKTFINDPDVTYLLPRAEDHIWQGPKGSFDPEKHGLKWPGLKSFHSYFGLLGGNLLTSEPLYQPDYMQQNALRMLEILNPPAPDKGWSMRGDIDPWGRQFGFVAERPWGNFASVVLWNKDDFSADLKLDTYAINGLGNKFYAWSFWDEKFLGIVDSSLTLNVEGTGCVLLRLTSIPEKSNCPVLVGSNLHISMGSAEIKNIESSSQGIKIGLTHGGAREGRLYVYSPFPLKVETATGCEAFVVSQGENLYSIVITDRSRSEENAVSLLSDTEKMTIDNVVSNPDLNRKYIMSGFETDKMN